MKLTPIALFLAALAPATTTQGSVKDGSQWTDGAGTTVTAQVSERADGAVDVTFVDHTGFSPPVKGTRGQGQAPNTTWTPEASTNSPDGNSYRVRDPSTITPCLVQKKNDQGRWVNLKPVRKKTNRQKPNKSIGDEMDEGGASMPGGAPPKPL